VSYFFLSLLNCCLTFSLDRRAWICDHVTISSVSTFEYGPPLILIANLEPFSKRSEEGYEPNPVRLRDMKKIIKIDSVK